MAILKSKNTQGEWVNIANADSMYITNMVGELKMETIEYSYGQHKQSLDLSSYISAEDNFILVLEVSEYVNDGTTKYYIWQKNENLDQILPFKTNPHSTKLTDGIFSKVSGSNVSVAYDSTTQTFSLTDDTYKWIYSFTILYASVKEA